MSIEQKCVSDRSFYGTDDVVHRVGLGERKTVFILPEKYVLLKSQGCREKSRNEILLQRIADFMSETCDRPCKLKINLGKGLNKFLDHLPYCETDQEANCYVDMFVKARKLGVTRKPCVKLQYKAETTTETVADEKVAEYKLTFSDPPKVTVREEYLIFDGITMISAIGGTLGLCIGFSFYQLVSFFFNWFEKKTK